MDSRKADCGMVCYPQGCGLLKGKGIRISSGELHAFASITQAAGFFRIPHALASNP